MKGNSGVEEGLDWGWVSTDVPGMTEKWRLERLGEVILKIEVRSVCSSSSNGRRRVPVWVTSPRSEGR